jgi:hypothetical protein
MAKESLKRRSATLPTRKYVARTVTHLVVDEHQVKGEDTDDDLDVLYLDIFLRAVRQVLESPIRARVFVDRHDLRVHDE